MEPSIIFDKVGKKFSKEFLSDSLRDAFTASIKSVFRKKRDDENASGKKEFWALKDVSFEVKPGEALGIIGPNGSGKSTTLKLLSRIMRPDRGKITVKGRFGSLIELGAGFHPDLTGRENVFLNASILGMSKEEISQRYDEIVDFAGVHDFMDTPVKWYSSGMHARLGFAVASHMDPEVLLVDEVLSVGDTGFQRKCLEKMKSFRENGATIVFVSHNLEAVSSLCDRAVWLNKGAIEKTGDVDEVIRAYLESFRIGQGATSIIELTKGVMLDASGAECSLFTSGQKAVLEMEILFKDAFSCIDFTLGVSGQKGQMLFWSSIKDLAGEYVSIKKGQKLSVQIETTMNLAAGEYEWIATLYDPARNKTLWDLRCSPTPFLTTLDW